MKKTLKNIFPHAKRPVFILHLSSLIVACLSGCATVTPTDAAAEQATYAAIAPEYGAYVAADPALTADQKARRQRTIQTWKLRIAGTPTTQP